MVHPGHMVPQCRCVGSTRPGSGGGDGGTRACLPGVISDSPTMWGGGSSVILQQWRTTPTPQVRTQGVRHTGMKCLVRHGVPPPVHQTSHGLCACPCGTHRACAVTRDFDWLSWEHDCQVAEAVRHSDASGCGQVPGQGQEQGRGQGQGRGHAYSLLGVGGLC